MPLDDSDYPLAHALKKLFWAGKNKAIGFKHQGGENSPFDRFVRYSYQKELDFKFAFKLGKARLLNEVDVYPAGIIAIRNFNGTETVYAIGNQITQDDFEKTFALIKERTINYERNKIYRYTWPAMNTSSRSPVKMDGFYILLDQFIKNHGKDILNDTKFKALFLDYLKGEHKKDINLLLFALEQKAHTRILESQHPEETRSFLIRSFAAPSLFRTEDTVRIIDILLCLLRSDNFSHHITL
jgi:hypothetical protein